MAGLTDQERRIAEAVGHVVVARVLDLVQNEEVAEKVMNVWGASMDRMIGRGMRRLAFYVLLGVFALGAAKLGLWEKFFGLLKP